MLGLPPIQESFFLRNFIPFAEEKIECITNEFLAKNRFFYYCNLKIRESISNKNDVWLLLDGGWTHPGWWARECCMYAIDAFSGLPIARKYIIKGTNWTGSSKSMEAAAAKDIASNLHELGYKVTHLIHDKDASTLHHFKSVFSDVKELICTGILKFTVEFVKSTVEFTKSTVDFTKSTVEFMKSTVD